MNKLPNPISIIILSLVVLLIAGGYGGYRYWELNKANLSLIETNFDLQRLIDTTNTQLDNTTYEKGQLAEALTATTAALKTEQDKSALFEKQIAKISGTVGTLQKLAAIDPQLLQKYSKVYFLNDNYIPAELVKIDAKYLHDKDESEQIHASVAPFLKPMLDSALENGVAIQIVSAYRSFAEQASVKSGYKVIYGAGSNQFSADQGYSEHQLGTTIDLVSPESNQLSLQFENSLAYKWLVGNAYKFGFALSYPKNNSYYQFEPWHWRFVGKALATKLQNENKHLYDLDQREISQYLISIFD